MRLRAPDEVPPMVLVAPPATTPLLAFISVAVPAALVPIRLPRTTRPLLVCSAKTPMPLLPEIRLPAPGGAADEEVRGADSPGCHGR